MFIEIRNYENHSPIPLTKQNFGSYIHTRAYTEKYEKINKLKKN